MVLRHTLEISLFCKKMNHESVISNVYRVGGVSMFTNAKRIIPRVPEIDQAVGLLDVMHTFHRNANLIAVHIRPVAA